MQQPSTPAALPGAVQALQPSALARQGFTQTDQVNQLVAVSETDPDLGFMGRMMALCSLPRSNPGNRLQYKRVNDPYTLIITATGNYKLLPYGNLPRLLMAWVSTEAAEPRRSSERGFAIAYFHCEATQRL